MITIRRLLLLSLTCTLLTICHTGKVHFLHLPHNPDNNSTESKPTNSKSLNLSQTSSNTPTTTSNTNQTNFMKQLDEILLKEKHSKDNTLVKSRKRRTLILLHEKNPEKAGKVGDNCSLHEYYTHVYPVYELASEENYTDIRGLEKANITMELFQANFNVSLRPTGDDKKLYATWGSKFCIGRYPMKCDNSSFKCKCLDLFPPMYDLVQDVKGALFCNARDGQYCNEEHDLYCAKSEQCANNMCAEGAIIPYVGDGVLTVQNNFKLFLTPFLIRMFFGFISG